MNWPLLLSLATILAAPHLVELQETAHLGPGPYQAGFRPERLHDRSRAWPSDSDPSGAAGRPIQIGLWYPGEAGDAEGMTVADLILADATRVVDDSAWSVARSAALAAARTAFDAGGDRPLTDAEWERALAARSAARIGVPALPGRRALVLLQGGLGTRSYMLAPVAELLASHGYVVAALGTAGASEKERLGFDLAGVRAQVADMQLALGWLRERPEVDPARVGLVGWSVGGVSQVVLRLDSPGAFRAAISLDSGSGYAYGAELLRQAGAVSAARLGVPFLHFDVGRAGTPPVPKDDAFLRAHPEGAGRRVLLDDMRHADFTLPYGAGRRAATAEPPPAAWQTFAHELLAFLDAHLRRGTGREGATE